MSSAPLVRADCSRAHATSAGEMDHAESATIASTATMRVGGGNRLGGSPTFVDERLSFCHATYRSEHECAGALYLRPCRDQ